VDNCNARSNPALSDHRQTPLMGSQTERASRRLASRTHAAIARDLERLLEDAGLSLRALGGASGVDSAFIGRILAGTTHPTIETYARLASALNADLSIRLYPNAGPHIRDRWQAPMLEEVLRVRGSRWDAYPEVLVTRPTRGWIDVVLHDRREGALVATELQSELRRLEQLVRWQATKAAALPSWEGFDQLGRSPRISQLLIVRRTRATRAVAGEFARQLRAAFPAHPDDAVAALTGSAPWPGAALAWMVVDTKGARLVPGR
jgi:transcriptional regulator with XRE-family HTH domain